MKFSSPGEVAGLVLRSLFAQEAPLDPLGRSDDLDGGLEGDRIFPLHEFQETAARRARRIMYERGGVLVADSVGLGKTYIALALIEEKLRKGGRARVVIPAALRGVWRDPLQQLGRRLDLPDGIEITTHARLSRGGCAAAHAGAGLVVVDEAHRFRNPTTRRYQALARILRSSQALLLTATPVNNKVADLHHLLRLFLADGAVRDLGIPSLRGAFDAAAGGDYREVRTILGAVMVRRSRRILRARDGQSLSYPSRKATRRVNYQDPDLAQMARLIGKLELVPYGLSSVRHSHTSSCSSDAAALVRVGLLKRLESSRTAFSTTVRTHSAFAETFLDAAAHGRLVRPRDRLLGDEGDEDPQQLLLIDLLVQPAPPEVDLAAASRSMERDQARLKRLLALAQRRDPKLDALIDLCRKHHSERVLVFTEFRDTAEGLWQVLVKEMAAARIDGGGSWLGRRPASRQAIVERFAPISNRRPQPPGRERVDILIATDVLSEGANLQDARHVVSYDLPWNPVRLLQRIGRIDRLGSPHNSIYVHLFAPPPALDRQLALARRLRSKLGGISGTVGSEQPDRVLARVLTGPDPADRRKPTSTGGPDHPFEVLRAAHEDLQRIQEDRPTLASCEYGEPAGEGGPLVSFAHLPCTAAVLVLYGNRPWLLEWDGRGVLHSITTAGARRLAAAAGTSGPRARAAELRSRDRLKAKAIRVVEWIGRDVQQHLEALRLKAAAPPELRPNDVAARIARKIQAAIKTRGGADSQTLHRADRVLAALAQPLPAAAAADAAQLLRQPDLTLHQLMEELEGLLSGRPATPDNPLNPADYRGVVPQVVAVLLDPRKLPSNPVDGTKNGG